jgi:hypothetical protein
VFLLASKDQEMLNSEGFKNFMFEDAEFREYMEQLSQERSIPMFMKLIEQGKAEGAIKEGVSARAIMIFSNSLSTMMSNPQIRDSLDVELRKELTHLYLYGHSTDKCDS